MSQKASFYLLCKIGNLKSIYKWRMNEINERNLPAFGHLRQVTLKCGHFKKLFANHIFRGIMEKWQEKKAFISFFTLFDHFGKDFSFSLWSLLFLYFSWLMTPRSSWWTTEKIRVHYFQVVFFGSFVFSKIVLTFCKPGTLNLFCLKATFAKWHARGQLINKY